MLMESSSAFQGEALRQNASSEPLYFLYHVPKCAGRTIDRHLGTFAPEGSYYRSRKRKGPTRFFRTRYSLAGMPHPAGLKAISGHYIGTSLENVAGGRDVRRTVLLRDPVSHFVSYYNFRMARYIRGGGLPYSFELAYGATRRNFVTHFILRNFLETPNAKLMVMSDAEKWERVNAFLAGCWFVGDYSRCSELIASIAPDLKVPGTATPENIFSGAGEFADWRPVYLGDLTAAQLSRIREENHLDQRLWETWRDAGRDVDSILPVPYEQGAGQNFPTAEASRLIYQTRRRIARRWSSPERQMASLFGWDDDDAPQLG
ncbi:sulfotransferase family 2 domain-containing protein [Methyloligella sp. 2.7D]|uniref:sulfotransferase family 2 domain-containing protein n=1 Tax=unclassified Methyloligella TaxID=2625955 RepID=UPI00157C0606|nr:sulfotransferase family 2 domain-containing protein [Methyloligella sp. GL2]QKP76084.1 sulfotransferase family 2 domain-containing protein [Methyloligella sp. GL2]